MGPEDLKDFVDAETGASLRQMDAYLQGGGVCKGRLMREDGRSFEIRDFIPRFVNGPGYARNFELQWHRHRKSQLDNSNGARYARDLLVEITG